MGDHEQTGGLGRQKRVNGPGLIDVRLPVGVRRRQVTPGNVSAVCAQLGEHVSVRNVQRVLGGSMRDIAPLVRAWRSRSAEAAGATLDTGGLQSDQVQALAAIVVAALQEHARAVAESQENLARRLTHLEGRLELVRPTTRLTQSPGADDVRWLARSAAEVMDLPQALTSLQSKLDSIEIQSTRDAHGLTQALEAGLDRILGVVLSQALPAPAPMSAVSSRIEALEGHLEDSSRSLRELQEEITLSRVDQARADSLINDQLLPIATGLEEIAGMLDQLRRRKRPTAKEIAGVLWTAFDDRLDELEDAMAESRVGVASTSSAALNRRLDAFAESLADLHAAVQPVKARTSTSNPARQPARGHARQRTVAKPIDRGPRVDKTARRRSEGPARK